MGAGDGLRRELCAELPAAPREVQEGDAGGRRGVRGSGMLKWGGTVA